MSIVCFNHFIKTSSGTGCAFLSRIVPISMVTSLSMRERNRAISSVASVWEPVSAFFDGHITQQKRDPD